MKALLVIDVQNAIAEFKDSSKRGKSSILISSVERRGEHEDETNKLERTRQLGSKRIYITNVA